MINLKGKSKSQIIFFEIILTILGSFIMAIGVSQFLLPNQLSSGGVAGLATIFYYLFNITMGVAIAVINIPLFIFSIFKVGKTFFIKSLIGTITLSIFIDILDKLEALTNDRFLACIYGGILIGVGTAIILKANSSTGGSDMVSLLTKEYNSSIKTSNVIVIIDIVTIILNMIFFKQIEIGLYSAISIYLVGKMLDIFFEGIYFTKLVYIISDKTEEVAKEIGEKIKKGSTRAIW